MTMPALLQTLGAALPLVTIVLLMLAVRWSAARAGAVGLGVTLACAWGLFAYGREVYGDLGTFGAMAGAFAEALFTAGTILWIIFPALCIHQLQIRTGAIDVLQRALGRLSPDPRLAVLLVAWFFALFLEGAAGFGTTIALAAPMLVSLGFQPVVAVTMALTGHVAGVSFGAVGTPILPQMAATGLSGLALARANGFYHSVLGWVLLGSMMMTVVQVRQGQAGRRPSIWGWTLLAAALFLVPFFALSRWVGPELPTLGGALLGGAGFVVILTLASRSRAAISGVRRERLPGQRWHLLSAAAPYLILVLLILLTRLLAPVQHRLTDVVWEWALFERFGGSFQPLFHPGSLLFLGFLGGALWQRGSLSETRTAMRLAAGQLGAVTVALLSMLSLSRLMVHAGMIDSLAAAAANTLREVWPVCAPAVGVLGTFVTGSATASNILLSDFQQATAQHLSLPVLPLIGVQGFGAAVGNMICPHNIIAGGATVGVSGHEGEILRRTLGVCALYTLLGGLIALWIVR
jgi:lactate permease